MDSWGILAMGRTLTSWTLADYHRMIEIGLLGKRQVELIEGQIVEMSPELPIHRRTYRQAAKYLESLLGQQAVVFTTVPITLSDRAEPQPDVCVAMPPESRYDERHPQPQDIYWLVEVSNSTLAYDLGEKAQLYAKYGIREYWVMAITQRQLWVHREPEAGKYTLVQSLSSGKVIPTALPEVEVAVDRLGI